MQTQPYLVIIFLMLVTRFVFLLVACMIPSRLYSVSAMLECNSYTSCLLVSQLLQTLFYVHHHLVMLMHTRNTPLSICFYCRHHSSAQFTQQYDTIQIMNGCMFGWTLKTPKRWICFCDVPCHLLMHFDIWGLASLTNGIGENRSSLWSLPCLLVPKTDGISVLHRLPQGKCSY